MKNLLTLLLLLCPLYACSDDAEETNSTQDASAPTPMLDGSVTGDAGGAGGAGGGITPPPARTQQDLIPYVPNTYPQFVAEYAALACEKLSPCCTIDSPSLPDTCEELFSNVMQPTEIEAELIRTDEVVFMADRAEGCLEALRAVEGCLIDKVIDSRCAWLGIIADFRGVGATCDPFCDGAGAECVQGVCERGGRRAQGEECGLTCGDDGYCTRDPNALNDEFEATRAGTCFHRDALACLNGRCAPLPGEGEACSPNNDESDISSQACQNGYACRDGLCVRAARLREGDACEFYTPEWCGPGLTCDTSGGNDIGACIPQVGPGEPCFDNGGPEEPCLGWLACDEGVCTSLICESGPTYFLF